MDKIIKFYKDSEKIVFKTSFKLRKGYDSLSDIYIDTLELLIREISWDWEIISDHEIILPSDFDLFSFEKLIKKAQFSLQETQQLELEDIGFRPQLTEKSFKRKSKLPVYLTKDLKDYIRDATFLKLGERIIEDNRESPSVEMLIRKAVEYLNIRNSDKAVAISFNKFCSLLEWHNKILGCLNLKYKGIDRLDFLRKHRDERILEIYNTVFGKSTPLEGTTVDGWLIVDAARLYEIIYKFGTRNQKGVFYLDRHYVIRPFRSEYILILKKSYLDSLMDEEFVYFSIRRINEGN